MKRFVLLFLGLSVFLAWCSVSTPKDNIIETSYTGGSIQDNSSLGLSWDNKKEDISLHGNVFSGINISWQYSNITNSWDILYYDNIFTIALLEDSTQRSYDVTYSPIASSYIERLWIDNSKDILISIESHNIDDIKWLQWRELSEKELCIPHYEEWIRYQPKTIEKVLWDKKIYITYATFDVSGPDMEPFKNYQSEICFVQDDRIYTITIWDTRDYRKDIVESFRFLQ